MRGPEFDEQVNVITGSTDAMRMAVEVAYDSTQIAMEIRAPFGRDTRLAILRREDEVKVQAQVG